MLLRFHLLAQRRVVLSLFLFQAPRQRRKKTVFLLCLPRRRVQRITLRPILCCRRRPNRSRDISGAIPPIGSVPAILVFAVVVAAC